MSHKLLSTDIELHDSPKKGKQLTIPSFNGKFGAAIFIGGKEIFLGVSIAEVEIERIVRKRLLKAPSKGKVKVLNFD